MASAESTPNAIESENRVDSNRITVMLVGAAGAGKSSLINSLIKLVQLSDESPEKPAYIPTATTQLMGGHTMMREPIDLTDTLTILDNRGWHDWTNKVSIQELVAQIRGERYLEDDVNWEKGAEEELPFAVSPKVDCISIVINGEGGLEAMEGIRELIDACRKNIGRRPSVVITHKDEVTAKQIERMKATLESYAIEPENMFVVQNVTTSNDNLEASSTVSLCQFIKRCTIDGNVGANHSKRKEERHVIKNKSLQALEDKSRDKEIRDLTHNVEVTKLSEAKIQIKIQTEIDKQRADVEEKIMLAKQKHEQVSLDVEESYMEESNKRRAARHKKYLDDLYAQRLKNDNT